ncbi:MAG: peptidylprolyl isomerase [Ectothiorhodospiraceae bacterium]|nr:peptidylprolyl isomerase [Chromatiales bacterium]MCP5153707.1 peptidylprolyl isomerase [Ectothiorhodospiraceae bacterium]
MKAERNHVIRFHYTLHDEAGDEIETSRGGEPMAALLGHENVLPGVEAGLLGREAGEAFTVTVPPEEGYGPRREGWTQRVSKKHFREPKRLRVGSSAVVETSQGPRPVTVIKVGGSVADVDLNHPLAGRTLRFDIEVVDVRAAETEEIAHGHVHHGGHHH